MAPVLVADQIAVGLHYGFSGGPDGYMVDLAIPPTDCMLTNPFHLPDGWKITGYIPPSSVIAPPQPAKFIIEKIFHSSLVRDEASARGLRLVDENLIEVASVMDVPSLYKLSVGHDGRILGTASSDTLFVADPANKSVALLSPGVGVLYISALGWLPDQSRFLVHANIISLGVSTAGLFSVSKDLQQFLYISNPNGFLWLSTDAKYFVVAGSVDSGEIGSAFVLAADSGKVIRAFSQFGVGDSFAFHPLNSDILYVFTGTRLWEAVISSGSVTELYDISHSVANIIDGGGLIISGDGSFAFVSIQTGKFSQPTFTSVRLSLGHSKPPLLVPGVSNFPVVAIPGSKLLYSGDDGTVSSSKSAS